MTRLSLKRRVTLWSIGAPLSVLIVVLVVVSIVVRGAVFDATTRASARTNVALRDAIDRQEQELARGAAFLSYLGVTRQVVGRGDRRSLEDYLEEYRQKLGADWLIAVDPDGVEIGSTKKTMFSARADLRPKFGIAAALDGGTPSMGVGDDGARYHLHATSPIQVGQVVYGALIAGIELNSRFAAAVARENNVELAIYVSNRLVGSSFGVSDLHSDEGGLVRVTQGGVDYVGRISNDLAQSENAPIRFAALVREDAITAPFARIRIAVLVIALITTLVSAQVGLRAARGVTSAIAQLATSAEIIRSGEWPEPAKIEREDELGLLQGVFDEMVESLRANKRRLLAMLELDPLTELMNHRTFRDQLALRVQRAIEAEEPIAVALFDIDEFESFNRRFGAEEGDRTLVEVAERIRVTFGLETPIGRYGGNEFAVVLPSCDYEGAIEQARSIIAVETSVTVSVGYAVLSTDLHRADMLLLAAEMAVGQAKHAGRNRVRKFEGFKSDGVDLVSSLQRGSYAAIRALAEAVDAKDEYTRGHSQRVADYARALAITLGYDEGFVELVYETGTLHDVGKIGVPDDVLKKASKLTDEDFAFIRRHPEMGERIVSQIPQLRDSLPGIRHHHERWDGRGYPDGLAGEDIPVIARVLALADTFDAMTSDRPYRPGMDAETAFAEIERNAGTQFDPDMAPLLRHAIARRKAA